MASDDSAELLGIVVILGFFYMYYLAIFERRAIPVIFCSIFTPVIVSAYSGNKAILAGSVILALVLGIYYMARAVKRRKISHFLVVLLFVFVVLAAYGNGGIDGVETLLIPITLLGMLWYGAVAMWNTAKLGYQDLTSANQDEQIN